MANLNKKIKKSIGEMPKYEIQSEAFDNQAIAKGMAYGRNRAIQQQEQNIDKGVQESISDVQDVTNSTSGLLSTIAAINANAGNAKRQLASDEAMLQQEGKQVLMGANNAMIDEKDKQWRQNVYAPWDANLRNLQRRKANKDRVWSDVGNGFLGALQSFLGGGAKSGGGGGGFDNGTAAATGGGGDAGGGMMKGMGQSGMGFGFSR